MNRTFIIAEAGINHNGDINLAKELIKGAKEAGADAIKFQKRCIEKVYTKAELDKPRESPFGTTNRELKEHLEFNEKDYDEIDRYSKEIDIQWSASPWDLISVEFLKKYDLSFNKIPSARLGHRPLLREVARQKKYTYISTGMASLQEIREAIDIFKLANCPFELMHCNSQYPMPLEESNLLCMKILRKEFNCNVGFSDHHPGMIPSIIAVALGATSIEKHITTDRTIFGSDQASSVEIHGFKKMIEYIRVIPDLFGEGHKIITEEEWAIRNKLWKTVDID